MKKSKYEKVEDTATKAKRMCSLIKKDAKDAAEEWAKYFVGGFTGAFLAMWYNKSLEANPSWQNASLDSFMINTILVLLIGYLILFSLKLVKRPEWQEKVKK